MPREKARLGRRLHVPVRVQDQRGLEGQLVGAVDAQLVAPLAAEVAALEATVAAIDRGEVAVAEIALPRARSGIVVVEPPEGFTHAAVGRPALVVQGPSDDDGFGIVLFTGEVESRRRLRLHWYAPGAAPRRVRVVYLIG